MVGEIKLSSVLSTLASKTCSVSDKAEAYTELCSHFKQDELSFIHLDIANNADRLLAQIKKDILHESHVISQNALQILGYCLHDTETTKFISVAETTSILTNLLTVIEQSDDKKTCTRALWCVSKQNLLADFVANQVSALIHSCDVALSKWKGQAPTVEHEVVCVVTKLVSQVRKQMEENASLWVKLLLPLSVHHTVRVKEKVITLFEDNLTMLISTKGLAHSLVGDFKSKLSPEMKRLFLAKNELMMLRLWKVFVTWFGSELHSGVSLINPLLSVAELGFKHSVTEVKIAAFDAWRTLIDNFATNPSVLSDVKRIKLIMQVLKLNNYKKEQVALAQFDTWWHFIKLLGAKSSAYFEQVVGSLLNFCMGGIKLKTQTIAATSGTSQGGPKKTSNLGNISSTFTALEKKGCEALACILASRKNVSELPLPLFTIDELSVEMITGPVMFLKHSTLLITSATQLICSPGADIPSVLVMNIWQSLTFHMKTALTTTTKSENGGAFSTFLSHFQKIILSERLSDQSVLTMFKMVCSFPQKVLSSTAYNIKPGEAGEIVRGTPALFLCEVLLSPVLLKQCAGTECYVTCYSQLVSCGVCNCTGVLEFCQAAAGLIDRNAEFVPSAETLWRLWSVLAKTLHELINKTNEVNQGDCLEYNFTCLYFVLLIPVKHKIGSKTSSPVCKTLMKTWSELYRSFARMAALVPNAAANTVCEEYIQKIHVCLSEDDLKDARFLDFITQICEVVISCVDFSSFGSAFGFISGDPSSPSKWKGKKKPLENLHSFVILQSQMLEALVQLSSATSEGFCTLKKKIGSTLTSVASGLTEILSTLFTHVSTSNIISNLLVHLSSPLAQLFHCPADRSVNKLHSPVFMQKLEKLWLDISTCIQSRYSMPYDSDFLSHISPLLEVNFLHPRRQIKNQTMLLWNATFSHSAPLAYPDKLKSVLLKVKEKMPISLPGFMESDAGLIDETPLSQFVQNDSVAPEPHIPGLPSPRKIVGSFLNKAVSPKIKKSPAKPLTPSPKAVSGVKKKLKVDDFRDDEFVVISTIPKRKRILTDHQKEVLKEKKILPTMYSSLDASLDTSLMSQLADTQQESQSQTFLPDSVITISSSYSEDVDKHDSQNKVSSDFSSSFLPQEKTVDEQATAPESQSINRRGRSWRHVTFSNESNNSASQSDIVEVIDKKTKDSQALKNEEKQKNGKTKGSRKKISTELSSEVIKETEEFLEAKESSEEISQPEKTIRKTFKELISSESRKCNNNDSAVKSTLEVRSCKEKGIDKDLSLVACQSSEVAKYEGVVKESLESQTSKSSGNQNSSETKRSRDMSSDSNEIPASDSLKQNLLAIPGINLFDVLSRRSTSSTDENISSGENPKVSECVGDISQTEKEPEINVKSDIKNTSIHDINMSSHPPERKNVKPESIHRQISPNISFSQDAIKSLPSRRLSPRRKAQSQDIQGSGSPGKKSSRRNQSLPAGNSCLDMWLTKSPAKENSSTEKRFSEKQGRKSPHWLSSSFHLSVDDSCHGTAECELSQTLVEDTQTPTKFCDANKTVENPHTSVEETPVKESCSPDPLGLHSTSRNLFGNNTDSSSVESSSLMQNRNLNDNYKGLKLKSPVICIPKLSTKRVDMLSQGYGSVKNNKEDICDIGKIHDLKEENSEGFSAPVEVHNIISDILNDSVTLAQQNTRSESQGSEETAGFSGILSVEQRIELNQNSDSSGLGVVVCIKENSVNLNPNEKISSTIEENLVFTEEMFSEVNNEKESQGLMHNDFTTDVYNSQLESTLKGSDSSSEEKSDKLSQGSSCSYSKEKSAGSKSSSEKSSSQKSSVESETYKPDCVQTFAGKEEIPSQNSYTSSLLDTVNSEGKDGAIDRKRKQNNPKKLSPSQLRRTPRSRQKSKCPYGGSCCEEKRNETDTNKAKKSGLRKSARSSLKFDTPKEINIISEKEEKCSQPNNNDSEQCKTEDDHLKEFVTTVSDTETPTKGMQNKNVNIITGEETPDSRTLVTPIRKSTTKHKMEEAKRRSLRDGHVKSRLVSDGAENETELSQTDLPKKKPRKSLCLKNNLEMKQNESIKLSDSKEDKETSSEQLSASQERKEESDKVEMKTGDKTSLKTKTNCELNQSSETMIFKSTEQNVTPLTSDTNMTCLIEMNKMSESINKVMNCIQLPKLVEKRKIKPRLTSPLRLHLRSSRHVLRARQKARSSNQSPKHGAPKRKLNTKLTRTTRVKQKAETQDGSLDHCEITEPAGCEQLPSVAGVSVLSKEDPTLSRVEVDADVNVAVSSDDIDLIFSADITSEPKNVVEEAKDPVITDCEEASVSELSSIINKEEALKTELSKTDPADVPLLPLVDAKSSLISDSVDKIKSAAECIAVRKEEAIQTASECDTSSSRQKETNKNFLPPLDETPKKYKIRKKVNFPKRVISSDSKLHVFAKSKPKYSDRGMTIVRRSILKHQSSDQVYLSPLKRSHDLGFRPISVSKVNSPSASPSAGILKRRFFHHALAVDSPSPPEKERRVSFAEPVVSGESPKRWKFAGDQRKATPSNTLTGFSASELDEKNTQPSQVTSSGSSDFSQSAGSYKSTHESQLDSKEPVYPDLIGCTESVAKVLPQLTSSMWSRGLVQLVKARNINTVGDLCSLSELEIHNLPIRSPKVLTVRKALQDMEQQISGKKHRTGTEDPAGRMSAKSADSTRLENKENVDKLDSVVESVEEAETLPSADDALRELDQKDSEELNSSIEDGEDVINLLDISCVPSCKTEASKVSCDNTIQSGSGFHNNTQNLLPLDSSTQKGTSTPTKMDCAMSNMDSITDDNNSTPRKLLTRPTKVTSTTRNMKLSPDKEHINSKENSQSSELLSVLENLVQTCTDIDRLRTADLFTIHQHLSTLSSMVVTAMKNRCSQN